MGKGRAAGSGKRREGAVGANPTRPGPTPRGRGEDGGRCGREEALERGSKGTAGTPGSAQGPTCGLRGTGAGQTLKSLSPKGSLPLRPPARPSCSQINGHAGSFQKRRNRLSSRRRRGIYSIYKYLHVSTPPCRRGPPGRPHGSCGPGRGRRSLAENNKYHFLPRGPGALALAARPVALRAGEEGGRGGARAGELGLPTAPRRRAEDPVAARLEKGGPAEAAGLPGPAGGRPRYLGQ